MNIQTARYLEQKTVWPTDGRYILAQYDQSSVVVYQAYRLSIGEYAVQHQRFGGDFGFNRMSWIKPNFLWMMYRSGWGTKLGQEITLAIRLRRDFFESVLAAAVSSSYDPDLYSTKEVWKESISKSLVRLQWDPDHAPSGAREERRAIQLGLRGAMLREYGRNAIVEIIDLSEFVASQRTHVESKDYGQLVLPIEQVYVPSDPSVVARLKLSTTVESERA
ncbi:MAG: DUF4291 domain-containing protein [Aestuariibacter sp.]|nr:DUF4291 domain-containing protein [Aestuariibacter sp.]